MNKIFFISVLLIIFIYFISIKYISYREENINYNENTVFNKDNILNSFKNILDERLNLLNTMSYNEWIEYNKKNKKNNSNNLFIWEKNIEPARSRYLTFVNRVFYNNFYENMSFENICHIINDKFRMSPYKLDTMLIKNMYYSNNKYDINTFFWINDLNKSNTDVSNIIKNISVSCKFKKNNIEGIIGLTYPEIDIIKYESFTYYNVLNKTNMFMLVLFIFITSYILLYINRTGNIYIVILLLFIVNFYIIYYLLIKSDVPNYDTLMERFNNINTSTLSIAFLLSVNVFIINYMGIYKINNMSLYNSNIFLFCIILVLLLSSLYKKINFIFDSDIRSYFLFNMLLFNLVIIYNIFIIIYYLVHIKNIF